MAERLRRVSRRPYVWFIRRLMALYQRYVFPDSGSVDAEEFGNAALFLRLGLPSTLIRHENGALRKRSSVWNLKTSALRFSVDGKHIEHEGF